MSQFAVIGLDKFKSPLSISINYNYPVVCFLFNLPKWYLPWHNSIDYVTISTLFDGMPSEHDIQQAIVKQVIISTSDIEFCTNLKTINFYIFYNYTNIYCHNFKGGYKCTINYRMAYLYENRFIFYPQNEMDLKLHNLIVKRFKAYLLEKCLAQGDFEQQKLSAIGDYTCYMNIINLFIITLYNAIIRMPSNGTLAEVLKSDLTYSYGLNTFTECPIKDSNSTAESQFILEIDNFLCNDAAFLEPMKVLCKPTNVEQIDELEKFLWGLDPCNLLQRLCQIYRANMVDFTKSFNIIIANYYEPQQQVALNIKRRPLVTSHDNSQDHLHSNNILLNGHSIVTVDGNRGAEEPQQMQFTLNSMYTNVLDSDRFIGFIIYGLCESSFNKIIFSHLCFSYKILRYNFQAMDTLLFVNCTQATVLLQKLTSVFNQNGFNDITWLRPLSMYLDPIDVNNPSIPFNTISIQSIGRYSFCELVKLFPDMVMGKQLYQNENIHVNPNENLIDVYSIVRQDTLKLLLDQIPMMLLPIFEIRHGDDHIYYYIHLFVYKSHQTLLYNNMYLELTKHVDLTKFTNYSDERLFATCEEIWNMRPPAQIIYSTNFKCLKSDRDLYIWNYLCYSYIRDTKNISPKPKTIQECNYCLVHFVRILKSYLSDNDNLYFLSNKKSGPLTNVVSVRAIESIADPHILDKDFTLTNSSAVATLLNLPILSELQSDRTPLKLN